MIVLDPQTLQIFAYIAVVAGLGSLIYGRILGRSAGKSGQLVSAAAAKPADDGQLLASYVLQGGGIGWLAGAAIWYFASNYEWAFMAGFGAMMAGSSGGCLTGLLARKAKGAPS